MFLWSYIVFRLFICPQKQHIHLCIICQIFLPINQDTLCKMQVSFQTKNRAQERENPKYIILHFNQDTEVIILTMYCGGSLISCIDTVRSRTDTIPNRKSAAETTNLSSLSISKVGVCLVQMMVKEQGQPLRPPSSFTREQTSLVQRSPSIETVSNSRTISLE